MILYALTIFTSSFLLFLVQPIMAKQILPWFGGSAAVWTTCLVFFQFLLLFGYAYADWTTRKLRSRRQVMLHMVLLALSLAVLPIVPDVAWKPVGDEEPTLRILGLLLATIGLPYFLLSTTGPLVQAWFARAFPAGTVYRLFALSNLASLLALLSYPFAVEPWITTRQQSYGWTTGYVLFVLLCMASAAYSLRAQNRFASAKKSVDAVNSGPAPRFADYAFWLLLSAMGSFMLLAVTNHITHDVASVPFLWILPLTLYLVTFILCFEGRGWYQRRYFLGPLLVVVGAMAWGLHVEGGVMDIKEAVPLYLAGLFVMLHVLSRRTGGHQARAALSDDLLSDGVAGRRAGRRARRLRRAQTVQHLLRVRHRPRRHAAARNLFHAPDAGPGAAAGPLRRRIHQLSRLLSHPHAVAGHAPDGTQFLWLAAGQGLAGRKKRPCGG